MSTTINETITNAPIIRVFPNEISRIKDLTTGANYNSLYELVCKTVPFLKNGHMAIGLGFFNNIRTNGLIYNPKDKDNELSALVGHKFSILTTDGRVLGDYTPGRVEYFSPVRDLTTGKLYSSMLDLVEQNYTGNTPSEKLFKALADMISANIKAFNGMYCPVNKRTDVLSEIAGHRFNVLKKLKGEAKEMKEQNDFIKEGIEMSNSKSEVKAEAKITKEGRIMAKSDYPNRSKITLVDLSDGVTYPSIGSYIAKMYNLDVRNVKDCEEMNLIHMCFRRRLDITGTIVDSNSVNSRLSIINGKKYRLYRDGVDITSTYGGRDLLSVKSKKEEAKAAEEKYKAEKKEVKEARKAAKAAKEEAKIAKEKTKTEQCLLKRGSVTKPEKVETRHYRMKKEIAEFLEAKGMILDSHTTPIINECTGVIYNGFADMMRKLDIKDDYPTFYEAMKPAMREGGEYNGERYSYVDDHSRTELENIVLKAEVSNLNSIVIQLQTSMNSLAEVSKLSIAKIAEVNKLLEIVSK